jgi:hypothetical protein
MDLIQRIVSITQEIIVIMSLIQIIYQVYKLQNKIIKLSFS